MINYNSLNLAIEAYKNRYGEDSKLEEGDEFVTVYNDGILILSVKNGELGIKIIQEEAFKIDDNILKLEVK